MGVPSFLITHPNVRGKQTAALYKQSIVLCPGEFFINAVDLLHPFILSFLQSWEIIIPSHCVCQTDAQVNDGSS